MPKAVRAARYVNTLLGVCLLAVAIIPGVIVGSALYYDGLASVVDWAPVFNWLTAIIVVSVIAGAYLIVTPQRVGVDVAFHPSGFTLRIRPYFRKEQTHRFDWAEIGEVILVKGARNTDGMQICPSDGAPVGFPIRLVETDADETLARFRASAEASGYRLVHQRGFNALIIEKQVWRVVPNTGSE